VPYSSLVTLRLFFFLFTTLRPPLPPPFPYTTLFRSAHRSARAGRLDPPASGGGAPALRGRRRPAAPEDRGAGRRAVSPSSAVLRSEEHTSELQSRVDLVCRLLLEKKKRPKKRSIDYN